MFRSTTLSAIAVAVLGIPVGGVSAEPSIASTAPTDFSSDVRPILADACFSCHGPDEDNRQAGLRLDSYESATENLGGYRAIEPGNREHSEVWERVSSDDPDQLMPPPESGKQLSPKQIETLGAWIDGGAAYVDHWSFTSPVAAELPVVDNPEWMDNPIDRFVAADLAKRNLAVSPTADRETLLRRLSLDLIGLPPTTAEMEAFLNDSSADAYQTQVERLLGSEHFGERWARMWLDSARYADSDGYEKDKPRSVWFYRDWVIAALSADMPYDEFVRKQIAGDMLPNPTQDDMVATGFLRNSMQNEEGGVDPEQYRMEAMYDRMDAIGKSVLGLTIQCAQCHSHKYDPISHTDYYGLFALLNNCHESSLTVYTPNELELRNQVVAQIDEVAKSLLDTDPGLIDRFELFVQSEFKKGSSRNGDLSRDDDSSFDAGLPAQSDTANWTTLDINWIENTISGQKYLPQSDGGYLQQGYSASKGNPQGVATVDADRVRTLRLEVQRDPNLPHEGPGRSVDGTWALTDLRLEYSIDNGETWTKAPFESAVASINPPRRRLDRRYWFQTPDAERVTGPVEFAIDDDVKTAWTGELSNGRRNDPQVAYFTLAETVVCPEDARLSLRVEMEQRHGGWNSDDNQGHNIGRFKISVTDAAAGFDVLPPALRDQTLDAEIPAIANMSAEVRRGWMNEFLRQNIDDEIVGLAAAQIDEIYENYPAGTGQLIVRERDELRPTFRLQRGDFLSPAERVGGGTPGFLHELPGGVHNRLELADWLVDRRSPTTARSIVNRIWNQYFGTGLVATTDDLGLQGESPSHTELLDYLAVELMDTDWSLKSLHRLIVSSQTYRQRSSANANLLESDPNNRRLARGPRFRVPAEMVRDIALTASGLLDRRVGGEPSFPPAPEFLFVPPTSYGPKVWGSPSGDDDEYRRGLYTFRFRSIPYPAYQAFDAPTGEVSCVIRSRSNTPLQALVTLNEPLFVECARHLAAEVLATTGNDDVWRIEQIYQRCLGRSPNSDEVQIVTTMLDSQRQRFQADPAMAESLLTSAFDLGVTGVSAPEAAAWMTVCRVVLNLDETITKE